MNNDDSRMTADQIAQTNGTLRLASQFIRELLDRDDDDDLIPLGASVVLLPPEDEGDSELRRANLKMAQDLADQGRTVVLWTVGSQNPTHSPALASQVAGGPDT